MAQIPKFSCSACGKCCSKIRGLVSDEEKQFIREYGYGKMPLIQLHPVDETTFPLWDFEAKRFRKYEKEANVDAKIMASRGIMDLNSNMFIVVTYHMNSEACPFLSKDGKCSIYNTRRAFICHLFPFNKSPFLETGKKDSRDIFGKCPNIVEIIDKLEYDDRNVLAKQLYVSFGNSFLAAIQHDHVIEWSNRIIIDLIKNKKIRPALNYPYNLILKRIKNAEKMDFTDFLIESGYKTRDEVDKLIKGFENFDDARGKLRNYISV